MKHSLQATTLAEARRLEEVARHRKKQLEEHDNRLKRASAGSGGSSQAGNEQDASKEDDRVSLRSLYRRRKALNSGASKSRKSLQAANKVARARDLARLFLSAAGEHDAKGDEPGETTVPAQEEASTANRKHPEDVVEEPNTGDGGVRDHVQQEAALIIEDRVIRENMGQPLASRQGPRALAPSRAIDGKALTTAMRGIEAQYPGTALADLARRTGGSSRGSGRGSLSEFGRVSYGWSLHDRIEHVLGGHGQQQGSQTAAISAGIAIAKRVRDKRAGIQANALFAESMSSAVSYGSTIALASADGRFLVVDPLSGEVRLQAPEPRWRERGVSPFQATRVGPGDSRMIPCPFFLFKVVDLSSPSNGAVIRLGDPVWLVVAGGRGEGTWRKGSVLGTHVQQGVELEQAASAPYTATALDAVRNDSMNLLAVPPDFREKGLLEQAKDIPSDQVQAVLDALDSSGANAGLPAKATNRKQGGHASGTEEAAPIARQLMARARKAITLRGITDSTKSKQAGSPSGQSNPKAANASKLSPTNGPVAESMFASHVVQTGGGSTAEKALITLDDMVVKYVSRCHQNAVGLGGISKRRASVTEQFDADDVAGDASQRLRGKAMGSAEEINPIDKVGGELGVPVPTKAFVPRAQAENVLLGPTTQENVEGAYKPGDPGYRVLYQQANKKAIVLGKWLVEPAYKTRLSDGSVLGAVGPETRKSNAPISMQDDKDGGPKARSSTGESGGGSSVGAKSGQSKQLTSDADEAAFEWKSSGNEEKLAKQRREAEMHPKDLAVRKRMEAHMHDLANAVKSEDKHALGGRSANNQILRKGDKLLNGSKVYLSQDWLYLCGDAKHAVEVPPSLQEIESRRIEAMLAHQAEQQEAETARAAGPPADTGLAGKSLAGSIEGAGGKGDHGEAAGVAATSKLPADMSRRSLRSAVAQTSLEYMRRYMGARRVILNRLESGVHGPFKVDLRGVFQVFLVDTGGGKRTTRSHRHGDALTSQARAQLARARRMRHGGYDRASDDLPADEGDSLVAVEIRTATHSIRMASGSQFSMRMHQARLEAQRAADRLYLQHEAAKGDAGPSYYKRVAQKLSAKLGTQLQDRSDAKHNSVQRSTADASLARRPESSEPDTAGAKTAARGVDESMWDDEVVDSDELDEHDALTGSRPWSMASKSKSSRAGTAASKQSRGSQPAQHPGARSGLTIRRPKKPLWVRLQATGKRIDGEVERIAHGQAGNEEEARYLRSTSLMTQASQNLAMLEKSTITRPRKQASARTGSAAQARDQPGSSSPSEADVAFSPFRRPKGLEPLETQLDEQESSVHKTASILEKLEAKAYRRLMHETSGLGGSATKDATGRLSAVSGYESVSSSSSGSESEGESRTPARQSSKRRAGSRGAQASATGGAPKGWDGRPVFGERLVMDGEVVASTALGTASERAMHREVNRMQQMPHGDRERLRTMVANNAKARLVKSGRRTASRNQRTSPKEYGTGSPPKSPEMAAASASSDVRASPVQAGTYGRPVAAGLAKLSGSDAKWPLHGAARASRPGASRASTAPVDGMPASRTAPHFTRVMAQEDGELQRLVQVASTAKREAKVMEILLKREDAYELPVGKDLQSLLAYVQPDGIAAKLVVPHGSAAAADALPRADLAVEAGGET